MNSEDIGYGVALRRARGRGEACAATHRGWQWTREGARLTRLFPSGYVWVYWSITYGWLIGPPESSSQEDMNERGAYAAPEVAVLAAEVIYG